MSEIPKSLRYINFFTNIFPAFSSSFPVSFVIRNILAGRVCCLGLFCFNNLKNTGHYTGYTQKNGTVSKVNKKCISNLTRAQRAPSAAATVQVSHALRAVRFSCLLRGCGASFQDGVAAGKGFLYAPF